MKLSMKKPFCEEPTPRQNETGTWLFFSSTPTSRAGSA